ncbi:cilium assembly protein DZIP1 [Leptidea sinapis]|uniref:cilium assembly protein DZIP1 n=1 Tax=Leptidea sinapis TaxID=189913 RepID=UPI0021C2D3A1|nr:cilium assembly protein DZIP1 [Leptidea sinapis]
MACKASFELYHNFPKLAEEAGFAFNSHRPRVHIEWNKIRLVDIDSLIRERKFVLIEQYLNEILDCVLESEFDVRILDEGFVKIFRLAQLAVEYQQFCRHYLDRSVHVLRDEVTALVKELDATKRNLREKEEENRRLKKRSTRHSSQNLLPYHNENIATLLLNTIKNQTDLFPSAPHLDALNYNKCNVCDKVFLNQLYLKSHIARRHPNINENNQSEKIPNKDPPINEEDSKLNEEVENLKIKLKEMESLILGSHNSIKGTPEGATNNETAVSKSIDTKIMKDAEVCCTSDEDFILSKIEQWKKEEFEKYNNEISLLRNQITNIIKSNEDKQNQVINKSTNKEIDQLQQTIKQQGVEINLLKQYIENSKSQKEEIEVEKKREIEIQISHWVQRLEEQSNQCKTLMQKLNDMEKEVEKYKAIAGAEKEKFTQLHKLVNQTHSNAQSNISESDKSKLGKQLQNQSKSLRDTNEISIKNIETSNRYSTLEKLQKKAQELLDQSSTSDLSSVDEKIIKPQTPGYNGMSSRQYAIRENNTKNKNVQDNQRVNNVRLPVRKGEKKEKKIKLKQETKSENMTMPMSPVKIIRAKITEEVNTRLVQLGVDPLRKCLPRSNFVKQRAILQEKQEIKEKKCVSREKIRHSIIAHLDNKAANSYYSTDVTQSSNLSPKKNNKTISSVLSNVKTKALQLVKSHKENKFMYNNTRNTTTKSTMPPESVVSSPKAHEINDSDRKYENKTKNRKIPSNKKIIEKPTKKSASTEYLPNGYDSELECDAVVNKPSKSIGQTLHSPIPKKDDKPITSNDTIITSLDDFTTQKINTDFQQNNHHKDSSYDEVESLPNTSPRKAYSEENIYNPKQTKGVLKLASSTSSLNKKKVLFDMDAIQMKSASVTPSQSLTEKSDDANEKYTLGLINLDTEEWDISSIENENHKEKANIDVAPRAHPKVAELKEIIESQMARRSLTSTALAGSVNVLPTPMARTSLGGSNTSLGSSILDESENLPAASAPVVPRNAFKNAGKHSERDDSDIDLSELLNDDKF